MADSSSSSSFTTPTKTTSAHRRLIVLRHGERIDFCLNHEGQHWHSRAFDAQGKYTRFNINMPKSLPRRKDGIEGFKEDTPLTEMGYLQAKITGRAFRDAEIPVDYVYCSSALRCVQTAVGILKGMNNTKLKLNVEPGLFEWAAWYRPKMPDWMNPQEFAKIGYPVNADYTPFYLPGSIDSAETIPEYYDRSHHVVKKILSRHDSGTIMLVAHGCSLDACTRQLCGGEPLETSDFYRILHRTPYLACAQAEELIPKKWRVTGSPILPLQHQPNASYDWKVIESIIVAPATPSSNDISSVTVKK